MLSRESKIINVGIAEIVAAKSPNILRTTLGLKGLEEEVRAKAALSPEVERELAWDKIKELIIQRARIRRTRLHGDGY